MKLKKQSNKLQLLSRGLYNFSANVFCQMRQMPEIKTLNEQNLAEFCLELVKADADLARILETCGTPPLWAREATFATLVQIILEQQVSLASARAAFEKLRTKLSEVKPARVLKLSDEELKACYFSRQKIVYVRALATAVLDAELDLKSLETLADAEVKTELKKIKGIGDWTADIYLLMALRRVDVMPKGDLALHVAYQKLKNLARPPNADEFQKIALRWQPFRAVAARLLWHFYLTRVRPQK